jgi:hypothetical protein
MTTTPQWHRYCGDFSEIARGRLDEPTRDHPIADYLHPTLIHVIEKGIEGSNALYQPGPQMIPLV